MKRWTLLMAAFLLAAVPSAAWAQAAIGYGMAASRSTTMATSAQRLYQGRMRPLASRMQTRTATGKPLPVVMEENRKKLVEESAQTGGKVRVESVPAKAAVAVDGNPVAYTPTELTLPRGKHEIALTRPDYLPWRIEISVNSMESTEVTAELGTLYKSSITLPKF